MSATDKSQKHNKDTPELVVSGKLADNERLKDESNYLRGTITDDLSDEISGGFRGDNFQLIRFHGMYGQARTTVTSGLIL